MGKKGKWFSSVKKALSPSSSKEKKYQVSILLSICLSKNVVAPSLPPQPEEAQVLDTTYEINTNAEAPEPIVETTVEVVRVAKANKFAGKSKEEAAAIMIQTVFRGYLARRGLRALRGLVRLKQLMEGPTVKRQAVHTLRCMQTLSRVQTQIHTRRVRMSEENQALQRQLLQKHAKELESLRMKEQWDDSLQSKEKMESNMLSKYEATMRRERALAYAFSHQQSLKNPIRSNTSMFMTPGNPSWGWSWLERWMSAHPSNPDKEFNSDQASVKSTRSLIGGEISKAYARYQLNSDKLLSPGDQAQSPSARTKPPPSFARKLKPASPRSSIGVPEDDTRSTVSMQSHRRHSIAGTSVRGNDESSSPSLPSYMVPTKSAKAKLRMQSPLGVTEAENNEKEKAPLGSAKKRLSYPSAKPRRHSGPPKVDSSLIKAENGLANGEDEIKC
ncbi:Protein IQ-DOMAIN 2 [Linum perenne]